MGNNAACAVVPWFIKHLEPLAELAAVPCLQIVGSTLAEGAKPTENFAAILPAHEFAVRPSSSPAFLFVREV
eukprot:3457774-Rhodomonas_salina.2